MNIEQVANVLGKAAAIDNRDVGRAAVLAWNEIIGELEYEDALAAVTRFRIESPGVYLEPGHVRRIARIIRDERRRGEVVKALPPSRFAIAEGSTGRHEEIEKFLQDFSAKRSIQEAEKAQASGEPLSPSDAIRERALARARAEKRGVRA
jgi:hypothetical protein